MDEEVRRGADVGDEGVVPDAGGDAAVCCRREGRAILDERDSDGRELWA